MVWPLDTKICKRNCQDCGLPQLRALKAQGLTTGTKCTVQLPAMKNGGRFTLRMRMTKEQTTINTREYGGMLSAHLKLGDRDGPITGAEWEVSAKDEQTGKVVLIGRLLFQGAQAGLSRIATFDEMLGCNKCNDMYHKDTRYGPFIKDGNTIRKPTSAKRLAKPSSCKQYRVTGNKADHSVTFEGGPGAVANFPGDNKQHPLW